MKKYILKSIRNFILLFFLVVNLFPLIWVLISSFKTNREILDYALSLPSSFNFNNYVTAFKGSGLLRALFNSLFVTTFSIILNAFVAFIAAYSISRYKFRFLGYFMVLLAFGLLVPVNSALLPIKIVMDKLSLTNSLIGLAILYTGIGIPMSVLILRSQIIGIPKDIDESADMDGAGPWRIALSIVGPVARPGIITVMILQAVYCWNEFLFSMILISDQERKTMQVVMKNFLGLFQSDYGALFASVVIAIIPVIIFFVIFQNQVVTAFSTGSVKQ